MDTGISLALTSTPPFLCRFCNRSVGKTQHRIIFLLYQGLQASSPFGLSNCNNHDRRLENTNEQNSPMPKLQSRDNKEFCFQNTFKSHTHRIWNGLCMVYSKSNGKVHDFLKT